MSPSPARRLITWPAGVLLVVATVVLGRLIAVNTPVMEDHTRAFVHTGQIGERVAIDTLAVTVLSVRGGGVVTDGTSTWTTGGVFVLVRMRLEALRDKPTQVTYAAVADDDGYLYSADATLESTLVRETLAPGIPIEGELVFEVPVDTANELVLELTSAPIIAFHQKAPEVVAEVRLGIDDEDVRAWLAEDAALTPMPLEVA